MLNSQRSSRPPGWQTYATTVIALGIAASVVLVALRRRTPSDGGFLLGITAVTIAGEDDGARADHTLAALARVSEIERALSACQPYSELARVNARAAQEAVSVSKDLFAAIAAGVEWHKRSRGAFDITVSPLLQHWRLCEQENRLPTAEELSLLRERVGAGRIVLDAVARTVRFPVQGMRVDLGGLGKGFCANEVVALLKRRGVEHALVAVGGDIFALGEKVAGTPWRIAVQDPRQPDREEAILTTLALSNRAVSTSGNYQRFRVIQGRRYSHIVDPRTGLTADTVPSVTVIGPEALTTDVLGTALSVLGVEAGLRLVEEMPEVEALFVTFDARDEPQLTRSSGFSQYECDRNVAPVTGDRTGW